MGLCKCEKRKVTLLFCFEHQVNVCEHCLLNEHSRCIVKTYVQWLQDADYNPVCVLCNNALADESCGDCVRLLCYDVVHWNCLNEYGENFPMNTAPAGYNCPVPNCKFSLFPAANAGSPLADVLRKRLVTTNWARRALGIDPGLERPDYAQPQPGSTDTSVERQSTPQSMHTHDDSAMRERPNLAVQIEDLTTDVSESTLMAPPKEVRTNLGGASTRSEHSLSSNVTAQGDDEKKRLRRSCLSEAKRVTFIQLGFCGLRPERCASSMSRCRPRPRRSLKIVMGAALILLVLFLLLSAMNHNSKDESYLLPGANPNIHVLPD